MKLNQRNAAFAAALAALCLFSKSASGFTQGVIHGQAVVPMGHEWITRQAAIEVLGGDDRWFPNKDPNDPRLKWPPDDVAKDYGLDSAKEVRSRIMGQVIPKQFDNRFAAIYKPVFDAILGERWVDIGGVNFLESKAEGKFGQANCLDAVTQEPPDVQYDHFMRKPSDVNGAGAVAAAKGSAQRFIDYFVAAATAPDGEMIIWDGGGYSTENTVDRHYFLFGRALHLFEDSFSPDHTVRFEADHFRKVRQLKSYICANGSEQHAHFSPLDGGPFYDSGDVIWISMQGNPGSEDWSAYRPSNMRGYALAATEGTKEAWAAFIRSMAVEPLKRADYARTAATTVARSWLSFDDKEMRGFYAVLKTDKKKYPTYVTATLDRSAAEDGGNGTTVQACMDRDWRISAAIKAPTQAAKLAELAADRRLCLWNMISAQPNTDVDRALKLPYDWRWRNKSMLETPPANWKVDDRPQLTVSLRIANRVNQRFLRQESGYIYNDYKNGDGTITFTATIDPQIPLEQNSVTLHADGGYLSRAATSWGLIGLYSTDSKGHFAFTRLANGYYSILNTGDRAYLYMHSDQKTYINGDGNPKNENAQWRVEGLPESFLVSDTYQVKRVNTDNRIGFENDKMVMIPYQGLGPASLTLERQPDESYLMKYQRYNAAAGFVRESADGASLVLDNASGSRFYLAPTQRLGEFNVQGESSRYWFVDPKAGSAFTPITADGQGCGFDPCDQPVIGLSVAGLGTRTAPPACEGHAPKPCRMPSDFSFSRVWPPGR
jgi:hypothetical protein